ncbi:DsbA family oxidoreductase [Actinopolyspora mortivallis]|uniref:DsbA family oxidoreductase n=1 Tax=Actinopolyspora mortivallis TaxID=33906 RepID=UPI0015E6106B|nr:DsbA family oxidoreductase [Actinopolyspora mortivallis]
MPTAKRVQLVLDVMCAWSYLGYNRLLHALSQYRAEGGEAELSFRPYQLAPHVSSRGEPVLDALRRGFGEAAAAETKRVAAVAADEGIELRYDRAIATNTFEAHRLIASASHQGLGEPMVERLFRAHFTDGVNVGDPDALAGLAAEVGVTAPSVSADEVRAALDEVKSSGVTGIPVFRFEGGETLTGFQPTEALLGALRGADPSRRGG